MIKIPLNTLFEKLLLESRLPEKDKHAVNQVFEFLPAEKQQRLISNFQILCINIKKINNDIAIEQKILFENFIDDMDELLKNSKTKNISSNAYEDIQFLKNGI